MADILLQEEDLKFASTMVHTLNTILLTSTELFQLRNQLKDLKTLVLRVHGLGPRVWSCARTRGRTAMLGRPSPQEAPGGRRDGI